MTDDPTSSTNPSGSPRTRFRVILVRTLTAGNIGSTARAMKNMGLDDLVLVDPRCSTEEDQARQLAAGSHDVLESARSVPDLATALAGCPEAIGFTARDRVDDDRVFDLPDLPGRLVGRPGPIGLVFGPEDAGLSNDDLGHVSLRCRIPTAPDHRSLNLSQAVLLALWEIALQRGRQGVGHGPASPADSPDLMQVRQLRESLQDLLARVGFLNPQNPDHIMKRFWSVLTRARLDPKDVSMFRGMVRQMNWKIDQGEVRSGASSGEEREAPSTEEREAPSTEEREASSRGESRATSGELREASSGDDGGEPFRDS